MPTLNSCMYSIAITIRIARIKIRANHNYNIQCYDYIRKHEDVVFNAILSVPLKVPMLIIVFHTTCTRPTRNSYAFLTLVG